MQENEPKEFRPIQPMQTGPGFKDFKPVPLPASPETLAPKVLDSAQEYVSSWVPPGIQSVQVTSATPGVLTESGASNESIDLNTTPTLTLVESENSSPTSSEQTSPGWVEPPAPVTPPTSE